MTTIMATYYTITDFSTIIIPGDYCLPIDVLDAINALDTLQAPIQMRTTNNQQSYNKTKHSATSGYNKKPSSNNHYQQQQQQQNTYYKKGVSNSFAIKDTDKQWEKMEKLKLTIIKKKEGVEKIVNDIRASLNKLTDKNYEQQIVIILDFIELSQKPIKNSEVKDGDVDCDDEEDDIDADTLIETGVIERENMLLIANSIFDIISQNQGLFKNPKLLEIYADLYIMLQSKYTNVFNIILNDFFNKFKTTIETIVYYDPNTHYDDYCAYNKLNEIRKSNTAFIVALFNKGMLHIDNICEFLQYFQNKFDEYLLLPDKSNELEQIAENIFILITKTYQHLSAHPLWLNDICAKTTTISKEKAKINYPSLTAKIIFKFKDIVDFICKQ